MSEQLQGHRQPQVSKVGFKVGSKVVSDFNPVIDRQAFAELGYLVLPGFLSATDAQQLQTLTAAMLKPLQAPVEYEADVNYPGSPDCRAAIGGNTPRRLLFAYSRHTALARLATSMRLTNCLQQLFATNSQSADEQRILLSQCHHNCIMTKHPGFSSATLWHQDIRYWAFERAELISAWFALTDENTDNGSLALIPGSHRLTLDAERFDERLFLRTELAENAKLIEQAVVLNLNPGDLVLFHCRTFHAAAQNSTESTKFSAVFTYHEKNNLAIAGSRSALYPSIALEACESLA